MAVRHSIGTVKNSKSPTIPKPTTSCTTNIAKVGSSNKGYESQSPNRHHRFPIYLLHSRGRSQTLRRCRIVRGRVAHKKQRPQLREKTRHPKSLQRLPQASRNGRNRPGHSRCAQLSPLPDYRRCGPRGKTHRSRKTDVPEPCRSRPNARSLPQSEGETNVCRRVVLRAQVRPPETTLGQRRARRSRSAQTIRETRWAARSAFLGCQPLWWRRYHGHGLPRD